MSDDQQPHKINGDSPGLNNDIESNTGSKLMLLLNDIVVEYCLIWVVYLEPVINRGYYIVQIWALHFAIANKKNKENRTFCIKKC